MQLIIDKRSISGWGRYPVRDCNIFDVDLPPDNINNFTGFNSFIARGMGRSYGDAALADDNSLVINTLHLDKFLSFDKQKGIIKVQAGVTLSTILDIIIPRGWFLPVVPGTRMITLGGALASNVHGKNHHNSGAIENFVLEFDILTEKGVITCSRQNYTELFFATIGGLGLTGIILNATLSLKSIETAYVTSRLIKVKNFEEALLISKENDQNYEYSVTWVDCLAKGKNLGRGIVMLGNHTKSCELQKKSVHLSNRWKRAYSFPEVFPNWLLNSLSIKMFNFGFYNKQLFKDKIIQSDFETYFFPLDFFSNWNALYGKQGFIQYQFAVPFENGNQAVKEALEFLSLKKIGSFLAVLKIVKEDTVLLPFAVPGFTLALDIPMLKREVLSYMEELDHIVIKYGGRVYLTKDSRLNPENFKKMYPDITGFNAALIKYAPNKKFQSLLSKRLKL